ncbi:hypothetical protein CsSME_00046323 [Camellia sinensis var. sinensis]
MTMSIITLQDLLEAVEKMNSILTQKQKIEEGNFFHQDELASLGFGHKGRAYLLQLLRMNRLVVETVDGRKLADQFNLQNKFKVCFCNNATYP